MQLLTKRVYEAAAPEDGLRILIDRLWPRGVTKEAARIDYWAKDIAPSAELRKWFGHDPTKWDEFRKRYHAELDANPKALAQLRERFGPGPVTLVFGSKEEKYNNATSLREYIQSRHAEK